jgi:threonine/homoserine/homoserine lactone efflux protein
MLVCGAMIISLPIPTLISAVIWLAFGLLIYFGYSAANARKMRENLTKY